MFKQFAKLFVRHHFLRRISTGVEMDFVAWPSPRQPIFATCGMSFTRGIRKFVNMRVLKFGAMRPTEQQCLAGLEPMHPRLASAALISGAPACS
jgi:hypothetical protein